MEIGENKSLFSEIHGKNASTRNKFYIKQNVIFMSIYKCLYFIFKSDQRKKMYIL